MDSEKMKIVGIVIQMPGDLAIKIVQESGDLAVFTCPAIQKLAECIAEALDLEDSENTLKIKSILRSKHIENQPTISTTA
jgi:hypothetical protein